MVEEDPGSRVNMKILMTLIGEIYFDRLKELATGKLEESVGEEEFMESKEKNYIFEIKSFLPLSLVFYPPFFLRSCLSIFF